MKIYTKTGDAGQTSLFGGGRVRKDHVRISAYGTIDELNACLGIARAELARDPKMDDSLQSELDELFDSIQNRLFDLGAELATPDASAAGTELLQEAEVERLEQAIDHFEEQLEPLKQFVLPGGTPLAGQLHLARTICRRAERRMVGIEEPSPVRPMAMCYVNRLSDLLFVLARVANTAGVGDVPWKKPS